MALQRDIFSTPPLGVGRPAVTTKVVTYFHSSEANQPINQLVA